MPTSWTARTQPTTEWTTQGSELIENWDDMTMTWANASGTWDSYSGGTEWTARTPI